MCRKASVKARQLSHLIVLNNLKEAYQNMRDVYEGVLKIAFSPLGMDDLYLFLLKQAQMSFYDRDAEQWQFFFGERQSVQRAWDDLEEFFKKCQKERKRRGGVNSKIPILMPFFKSEHSSYFVIPKFIINISQSQLWIQSIVEKGESFIEWIEGLIDKAEQVDFFGEEIEVKVEQVKEEPSFENWCHQVDEKIKKIKEGQLIKSVVCRKKTIKMEKKIVKDVFIRKLIDEKDDRFIYSWNLEEGRFFLGATPELVYQKKGNMLEVEAVAGTAISPGLLQEKELKEHEVVVEFLKKRLQFLTESKIDFKPVEKIKSANVYHFVQKMGIKLKEGIKDKDILEAIYPSPAITDYSGEKNAYQSSQFRELYSGISMLLDIDMKKVILNIRCMDLQGKVVKIYAGAGIVQGSVATREWNETQKKIAPFMSVLNNEK